MELINDLFIGDYSIEVTMDGSLNRFEVYNSEGQWLIDYNQKNGLTWISYWRIWLVFKIEYDMEYNDVEVFMKYMLLTHLKIEKTIPYTEEFGL